MAILKKKVLGQLNGSIADVTNSVWKGKSVVKSKAANVSNPQTPKQTLHRNKIKCLSLFAKEIQNEWLNPMWLPSSKSSFPFNQFMKNNISLFNTNGILMFRNMIMSKGILLPFLPNSYTEQDDKWLYARLYQPFDSNSSPDDEIWYFQINMSNFECKRHGFSGLLRGASNMVSIDISQYFPYDAFIWFAYRSKNGKKVSDSICISTNPTIGYLDTNNIRKPIII